MMSVANTVTSQPCQRLFMQGLDNTQRLPYAELSGLYSLINITFSGFPAYRHEILPNRYFFYNSTWRALVLGGGLLLAQTRGRLPRINVQYPYNGVITGWRVYQPATKRLLFRLSIVQLCQAPYCYVLSVNLSVCHMLVISADLQTLVFAQKIRNKYLYAINPNYGTKLQSCPVLSVSCLNTLLVRGTQPDWGLVWLQVFTITSQVYLTAIMSFHNYSYALIKWWRHRLL